MTMKVHHQHHISHLFFILSFFSLAFSSPFPDFQDLITKPTTTQRRILHQPLFPVSSAPPPAAELPPPQPTNPDQPFFHEVPIGQTSPDQTQTPPSPPASNNVSNPIAPQPSRPTKKVAIAISVGIVTLGMLSGLAFYLYKHRAKHPGESQKLVGGENSQRNNEDSRMPPPSTFLYIGTVEPSSRRTVSETSNGIVNGSPYHKLSSIKRSDRYRPSPELQPLPPLTKPQPTPPQPSMHSPPAMSSSDDEENHDFYTPQGSVPSTDEGCYYNLSSHKSLPINNSSCLGLVSQSRIEARSTSPVPHSKRTSPRSRLSISSPDKKQLPPLPPPLPPPLLPPLPPPVPQLENNQATVNYGGPRRAKFSSPPPPPDMTRLQSQAKPSIPVPPPPPPPKLASFEVQNNTTTSVSPPRKLGKMESRSPSPKVIPGIVKMKPAEEANINGGTDSAEDVDGSRPKLKPLHWDKVRATSDRATVWDQLKSSSFQLNEDMMESLFGFNSAGSAKKEDLRKSVHQPVEQENRVLDPKKSQNIAILLRALNVTREEVSEALLDGNPEGLGAELLETLVKMAPTKEEEIKLREYGGDVSKLGSAERFLKAILDIPFAFKRVEAMLYRANFDTEVKYLKNSFQTLEVASEELKNSRLFLKLLEAVLRAGNRMNVGTNRGKATAFKLDTLLKLVDIKGTDGKTTLLHFVVQEIIRSEGTGSDTKTEDPRNTTDFRLNEGGFKKQGLQVVGGLSRELANVKKAAGMDSDVLSGYVAKLETGLEKVRSTGQYQKVNTQGKFFESMNVFLTEAEEEIVRIKDHENKALAMVREVTRYFHGDTAKEGAQPLRIFMIVRDFLAILDNVCKEVGRMQDHTLVGSARSFRMPVSASLQVLNRFNVHHNSSSDEESSSL